MQVYAKVIQGGAQQAGELGGCGHVQDVQDAVARLVAGEFLPGSLERSLCVKVLFVLLKIDHETLVFQFSFISHDMYKKNTHRNIHTNSFKVLH